ncbi:MAG: hypothetical protein IJT58_04725, partial [Synergistaceae bacterium]|nr:hypothetical protein [Synergistaceae bacterium]
TSGTLPDGLTTESTDTTFTISGTPATGTAANSPYTYNVTASNDAGKITTVVTVNVIIAPVLSCDKEITLTEGEKMTDFTITATNKDTVTWSNSGTLPDGLTVSNKDNTFTITGTPNEGTAANSPYTYIVTAENAAGKTEAVITITVIAKPVLAETEIAYTGTEGIEISPITITATSGNSLTWSGSGSLPEGLTVSSKDNVFTISGTPASGTAANSPYTYTVTATNTAGQASSKVTITVKEKGSAAVAPVFAETEIAYTGTEGREISPITITATSGNNLTWSASGTLPEGLTVSSKDNVFTISGTPASGTAANSPYTYTVTAANTAGYASAVITITISGNGGNHDPESVKPVLSESAINYTYQEGYTIEDIVIRATEGNDLTWSASGTLPDGLTGAESNNKTSYTISGTLSMGSEGSYTYTVTAKNDAGEANCTVNITVETFVLSTDNLPEPETNQTLSEYLSETLGLSPEQLETLEDFKVPSKITTLEGIADLMPNLKALDLTAADSLGENIDLSALGNLQLERVNLSGNSTVKTLNLKGCNIQNVNAEGCTGLVSIDIAGNEFIEELQVSSTDISEINASGCENLRILHFANSKVSKLDLTGCVEMRDLDFYNNRVRRFNKGHFGLDKLSKLNAKHQRATQSLIGRIFDLAAFLLGYDNDGDISTAGIVINSAVNSGDENLISVTGYDESGSKIDYDDSEYPETGKIIFDKAPSKIIYNYDTGLNNNSMDVTISGTPDDDDDWEGDEYEESYLGSPSGGCDSGFGFGALLALAGLAFTRTHTKRPWRH